MINKKDFLNNVRDIINIGVIENNPLSNTDILKNISKDDNLMNLFYLEFEKNYPIEYEEDMLFTKTQDFIYRLNMAISDWLIPIHEMDSIDKIKSTLVDLVLEDIDLYSAVSFDESDKDIIDEFEFLLPKEDLHI